MKTKKVPTYMTGKDREEHLAKRRKHYAKHRERFIKQCTEYNAANKDSIRVKRAIHYRENRAWMAAHQREYRKTKRKAGTDCYTKETQRYLEKYPERRTAMVANQYLQGWPLPPCEHCGGIGKHRHHPDYRRPEYSISLCVPCHLAVHGKRPVLIEE